MHQHLKERLVGAAVLVVLAVIFIPMFLTGPIDSGSITNTNIPERPTEKFNSKLVPLTDVVKPTTPSDLNDAGIDAQETEMTTTSLDVEPEVTLPKQAKTAIPTKAVKKLVKDKQVGLTAWVVQLGSFSSKVNADKLNLTLRKSGFPAFVEPLEEDNKTVYRVRVGPELLRADADALLKKIKENAKLDGIVLNYP